MPATSLDTHKLVKELTATGFTEEQAEALTRALLVGRELDLSHLATEAGVAEQARRLDQKIERVYGELDRKIDAVHAELDRKIDDVRAELDRKIGALDRKIDAVRAELERRIDGIRADMEVLKRDMTIRLGAMIAAAVVLITALDRLL